MRPCDKLGVVCTAEATCVQSGYHPHIGAYEVDGLNRRGLLELFVADTNIVVDAPWEEGFNWATRERHDGR